VKNIFYPLEVAQTLMQTKSSDARDGVIPTLIHLYNTYGISSWFRGNVAANLSGTLLALGGFAVKTIMHGKTFENRIAIFLASVVPTQLVVAAFCPLQVAKVRMITTPSKYVDTIQTLKTIHEEEGWKGLFRGVGFMMFEALPAMATGYVGYELAGFFFRNRDVNLSPRENILLGILGSFIGTMLLYPFETAKKLVQSKKTTSTDNDSVLKTLAEEGEKHGLLGLYKGFSANVLKLPELLIQRALYQAAHVYFLKANGYPTPYLHPTIRVQTVTVRSR